MTQDLAPHDHPPYGTPTEEQAALADAVRRAFADATARRPVPPRHDALPVALDADLWAALAGMDLLGLGVPEASGGSGGGVQDLCVLLEEAGAAVAAVPALGTAVVTSVLAHAPDARGVLDAVVAGTLVVTPAWETFPAAVVPQARAGALALADGTVRGQLAAVPFGADGDLALACASRDGAPVAVLLDLRADGVTRTAVPALDLGEPVAAVRVDGVAPELVLDDGGLDAGLPVARLLVLAAAELVGTARRALDDAVAHAQVRTQFGRPIGSFQALKHLLADRFVDLDAARLLVRDAALLLDLGRSDRSADAAARTALVAAMESAHAAARDGLQVHGGIGFTWEQTSHVLVRRARARRTVFGPPARVLDALAGHVLAP
ncbi:acyl-CoA dehydrogenase family protein [Pseudonocardia broussonetiae]|uniref:Acyl-CoA/acyl-ACP dehydrogenase n=1 Tax=Pseudonocardia broussonetiae TaxID=2736640 RepID=A0A6M6JRT8_9PSEU|nr:acyl-CoA dehydrogenase family protein [Pseudonocardia broussonetiae]QJY49717.1 acyl-CoA/acyl-ACP dehydrogenase [Pseudonocardia broussonetiae]